MLTIIESPFGSRDPVTRRNNLAYARACLYHSLSLGEVGFASHLLYTQVLDDSDPAARNRGINAGLVFYNIPDVHIIFYLDNNMSGGMMAAHVLATELGLRMSTRRLPVDIMLDYEAGRFHGWASFSGEPQ